MSYAVINIEKMDRQKFDRFISNYPNGGKEIFNEDDTNYSLTLNRMLDKLVVKRKIRSDAVVAVKIRITSDIKFFDDLSQLTREVFFQQSFNFLKDKYNSKNIISACILDNVPVPYLDGLIIPITGDGRLCAKELFNRNTLISLHDQYFDAIGKAFSLERGGMKNHIDLIHNKVLEGELQLNNVQSNVQVLLEREVALNSQIKHRERELNALNKEIVPLKEKYTGFGKKKVLSEVTISKETFDACVAAENLLHYLKLQIEDLQQENTILKKLIDAEKLSSYQR